MSQLCQPFSLTLSDTNVRSVMIYVLKMFTAMLVISPEVSSINILLFMTAP